jgi:hypothetical protein
MSRKKEQVGRQLRDPKPVSLATVSRYWQILDGGWQAVAIALLIAATVSVGVW